MDSVWQIPHNAYRQDGCVLETHIFTGQTAEQFVIRGLCGKEEKERALFLTVQELLRDDPIIKALDFDQASETSLRNWIKIYLDRQGIAFGCFKRDGNILVSVDFLYVRGIRDDFPKLTEISGDPFRNFIKYRRMIERRITYFRKGPMKCKFLTSLGVFTSPAYRDIGIPGEMIRMRSLIARYHRIEVIGSAFIGVEMQDAAKRNKYKDLQTFRGPEDMAEVELDFDFGNIFPIKILAVVYKYSK